MIKFLGGALRSLPLPLTLPLRMPFASSIDFSKIRNIGISAHIDSGKTTFSQRVLFYAGKIGSIHQVKGSDQVGATMDFMQLEREKGITIQSAATHLIWNDYNINLIDTPGHVDFTIEVERALRVLDGAILILCGVGGVQPQTLTVNKQMIRYNVPRMIFVNKLDRMGANPWQAIAAARQKLGVCCAALQVPIGQDERLKGLIDIIHNKAFYFDGQNGQNIREQPVPAEFNKIVEEKLKELVGQLANIDEELQQLFLEEKIPEVEMLQQKIRHYTLERKFIPVFMGSAYKNKGVQLALDGVIKYLPAPPDKHNYGFLLSKDKKKETEVQFPTDATLPFVGYVFKLEESRFGQLTYIRVYQGKLKRGEFVWNDKLAKKLKVSRIVKMHANSMEQIDQVKAGDIFAIFGVDCSTGDTLTSPDNSYPARCQSMFVPDPVMSLTIKPAKPDGATKFEKAISKFKREDPTFFVNVDKQTEEMIISGMGELHLQIYVQRIKREYGVECKTGQPGVNYRQTISQRNAFDYLHKKQSGGAGQYARVIGYIEPVDPNGDQTRNEFVSKITGTNIPPQYINAVGKAFHQCCIKGPQTGYPIINTRFVLQDGATHVVDSSANAFAIATKFALTKAMAGAEQQILEPMMDVQINVEKSIYQGVMAGVLKRKGSITKTQTKGDLFCLKADVALRQMFGYAMQLRGLTSGEGQFSMEYKKHTAMPPQDAKQVAEKYKIRRKDREY